MIQFIEEHVKEDGSVIGVPYSVDPVIRYKKNDPFYFANTKEGEIINGLQDNRGNVVPGSDVEYSYTLYFDDVQSTNLFYQKKIFFASDSASITVTTHDSDVFFLYDTTKLYDEFGNLKNNECIDEIRTNILELSGTPVNGAFLYCLNMGCSSTVPGGFTESMFIGDNEYFISADFHPQHEEYEILLSNQGVNIPRDVQRALYETNVREPYTDWVTLNRKYKELLLNIMDIVYKKGSYKSLIDSLKWFEYGNIVKMHEYWSTPELKQLHGKEVDLLYTDMLQDMMKMYMKTTFISLSFEMQEMCRDKDGNIEYEIADEPIYETGEKLYPKLRDRQILWGCDDIALKMTLLGNYFATYFMPIHLDLLFSSIEDRVFAYPLRNMTNYNASRIDSILPHDYKIRLNKEISGEYYAGDVYIDAYITDKENTPSINVLFGVENANQNLGNTRFGVSQAKGVDKTVMGDNPDGPAYKQLFVGTGVLIDVDFSISSLTTGNNFKKVMMRLINSKTSEVYGGAEASASIIAGTSSSYKASIFIKDCGEYILYIDAYDGTGECVSGKYDIVVKPGRSLFNIYKLSRIEDTDHINHKLFDTYNSINMELNDYHLPQYMSLWADYNKSKFYYPSFIQSHISACVFTKGRGFYMCRNWDFGKSDGPDMDFVHYDSIESFEEEYHKGGIIDKFKQLYLDGWTYAYKELDEGKCLIILISYVTEPWAEYFVTPFGKGDKKNNRKSYNEGYYRSFKMSEDGEIVLSRGTVKVDNDGNSSTTISNAGKDRECMFYTGKRFIPSIWNISKEVDFSNVDEKDAVFICDPICHFAKEEVPTWEITNDSTNDTGKIINIVTPIFWCNNKHSKNRKGVYSITLSQKYNGTTTSWKYKHAFRVV